MRTPASPPLRSSNPALREDIFTATRTDGAGTMTVQGTVNKTAWLLVLALATASASWVLATPGGPGIAGWAIGASLAGLAGSLDGRTDGLGKSFHDDASLSSIFSTYFDETCVPSDDLNLGSGFEDRPKKDDKEKLNQKG